MALTVFCEVCSLPMGNPACPACRPAGASKAAGRADTAARVAERRAAARQHPIPGGTRQSDPRLAPGQDPPLTTRECADWMGLTTEFIRGAIDEGVTVKGKVVRLEAETLDSGSRRIHRIHLDQFAEFLVKIGWKRIPKRSA